jgi:hypothetical protein
VVSKARTRPRCEKTLSLRASEAIQLWRRPLRKLLDCFVASLLAMTGAMHREDAFPFHRPLKRRLTLYIAQWLYVYG